MPLETGSTPGHDKRKQSLYFPEDMLNEIQNEANRLDRSMSWMVQAAWRLARGEVAKFPSVNDTLAAEPLPAPLPQRITPPRIPRPRPKRVADVPAPEVSTPTPIIPPEVTTTVTPEPKPGARKVVLPDPYLMELIREKEDSEKK